MNGSIYYEEGAVRYTIVMDCQLDAERMDDVTEDVTIIADMEKGVIHGEETWYVEGVKTSHNVDKELSEDDLQAIIDFFIDDLLTASKLGLYSIGDLYPDLP